MDNTKMTDNSIDTDKHDVETEPLSTKVNRWIETETLSSKVNRWIALPMLALTVASCIIDIQTGKIGWAISMFLCAVWWIFICVKEFILRKSR